MNIKIEITDINPIAQAELVIRVLNVLGNPRKSEGGEDPVNYSGGVLTISVGNLDQNQLNNLFGVQRTADQQPTKKGQGPKKNTGAKGGRRPKQAPPLSQSQGQNISGGARTSQE